MSTTHVYFADKPMAMANQKVVEEEEKGHSNEDALNDDAIRQCRSVSPNCSSNSPIPRYERSMGFFRQLSGRFGLRSNDDLVFNSHGSNEDDTQSSSTDSCSSSAAAVVAANNNKKHNKQTEASSCTANDYVSCASSETSSTVDVEEQLQQLQHAYSRIEKENNQNKEEQASSENNDDDDDVDDVTDEAAKSAFNKGRKSFARSSFSRLQRRSTTSIRRAFEAFSLSTRSLSCSGATPPPSLPTSSASSSTNNGTPIKSALKSSSNLELNKKSQATPLQTASTHINKKSSISSCTSASCTAAATSTKTLTSSKTKTKPPPQRILRQPVSYTYLKGISGLPTQRVPRSSVCCQFARR